MSCPNPQWGSQCYGAGGTQCGAPADFNTGCQQPQPNNCYMCYRGEGEGQLVADPTDTLICTIPVLVCNPAFLAPLGLQRDDLIHCINGRMIADGKELVEMLAAMTATANGKSKESFTITYRRPFTDEFVTVTLEPPKATKE